MKKFQRILLVDDDLVTNYVNEELILDLKICDQVHVAENGALALEFIRKNWLNPDNTIKDDCIGSLIFLDIKMPVMDGFDFLEEFQKFNVNHHVQVVLLTTSENQKDVEKAKKYKVSSYLIKPLTTEKINRLFESIHP